MFSPTKLLVIAALAVVTFAAPVKANISQFVGTWRNVNSQDRGAIRLRVQLVGNAVRVQIWGHCTPNPCDWGSVNAVVYGPSVQSSLPQQAIVLRANYNESFAHRAAIIHPAGNRLRLELLTRFTDGSHRANYVDVGLFQRVAGGQLGAEDCVRFDPVTTHAALVQGRWKLVDGNQWILDFGNKKNEALRSAFIVKHYKFNKQCFIQRPNPSMTYWLVQNHSAVGGISGEDCVGFNPQNVQARLTGGMWKVVDGNHAMFAFPNQAQAVQAVKVIKHYRFTRSCFVGRPGPSMSYMRR